MPAWIISFLPFLLALPISMLWLLFGVPLLFRLFGVSIPLNPWKRRGAMLDPNQGMLRAVMLNGVLSWGLAMFIFTISDEYFRWRLHHSTSDQLTFSSVFVAACIWAGAGALFGLLSGFDAEKQTKN